jgi:hypothetical protein
MLIGMTVPPVGRDDDKTSGRRLRRVAETGTRSGGAGTSAGNAIDQVHEAEARSPDVKENGDGEGGDPGSGQVYTPDQVRRAVQLEERSYRHVQQEKHKTAEARGRAAEAHCRAARLHDQQADLGWGDVEEHREQAHEHREEAEADSAGTGRDQSAYRDGPSRQPMPPAGPDVD